MCTKLCAPTNGADDGASAVVPLGRILGVEVAGPFQLGAVVEMVESVTHDSGSGRE